MRIVSFVYTGFGTRAAITQKCPAAIPNRLTSYGKHSFLSSVRELYLGAELGVPGD